MFVRNHMTTDPVAVTPETLVERVAKLMAAHRIRHLLVVDEAGWLVGIVADRDVQSTIIWETGDHLDLPVHEIMTCEPVTIAGDAPVVDALALFCGENRFGALPVVTDGTLEGIITRNDILVVMCRLLGLDQPGRSIEVALPEAQADLLTAFEVLRACNANLISAIAARVRDDGDEPALYVRVAHSNGRSVEAELARAGLILLVTENKTTLRIDASPGRQFAVDDGSKRPTFYRRNPISEASKGMSRLLRTEIASTPDPCLEPPVEGDLPWSQS